MPFHLQYIFTILILPNHSIGFLFALRANNNNHYYFAKFFRVPVLDTRAINLTWQVNFLISVSIHRRLKCTYTPLGLPEHAPNDSIANGASAAGASCTECDRIWITWNATKVSLRRQSRSFVPSVLIKSRSAGSELRPRISCGARGAFLLMQHHASASSAKRFTRSMKNGYGASRTLSLSRTKSHSISKWTCHFIGNGGMEHSFLALYFNCWIKSTCADSCNGNVTVYITYICQDILLRHLANYSTINARGCA